jgi:hypothetical protein
MIDFDELRKTVAIKHGVLLGADDPILVTVTLNDLVLGRYVEVLTAQNEAHQKALAAALQEQVGQSKATAGRIITDAADYVSTQVRQAVTTALSEAVDQMRQECAAAVAASRESTSLAQNAQAAKTAAIRAAVVAGVCVLVAIAAMIVVLVK